MAMLWTVVGVVGGVSAAGLIWLALGNWRTRRQNKAVFQQARALFRRRREWLEAEFVTLASEHGKPRDLIWTGCEFDDPVSFARERNSGQLRALVGITISFEAEPGGAMEEVEAVCALRAQPLCFAMNAGPGPRMGERSTT